MDLKQTMVLIRQEDKTAELESVQRDPGQKRMIVCFLKGSKPYTYSETDVEVLENPELLELDGRAAYVDGMPVYAPGCILDFGKKVRIFQHNNSVRTVDKSSFTLCPEKENST